MNRRDLLAILILGLLVSSMVIPAWVTGRAFLPRHSDTQDIPWSQDVRGRPSDLDPAAEPRNLVASDKFNLIFPDQVYGIREAREEGHFPEWNPLILSGVPHAANPLTSVFYPPNWLLLLVSEWNVALLSAAIHILLCGVFFHLFLRSVGVGVAGSLVGAIGFAFSGWVAAHIQNTPLVATVCWWPLALFAVESRLRGHGRWSLMILALALAMMWLAGMPQLALLGTVLVAIWSAIGIVGRLRADPPDVVARHAGGLLLFGAVGGLLAAVQILATLNVMEHAGHQAATVESLLHDRFRPEGWSGLLFPSYLGEASRGDWGQHAAARMVMGEGPELIPPPSMGWGERTVYPGLVLLLLALVGLGRAGSRVGFALIVVAALGVALSTVPEVIRWVARVPLFQVGAPARACVLVSLVIPALAALGFDTLWRSAPPRLRPITRRPGVLVASALAVVTLAAALYMWQFEESALTRIVEAMQSRGFEDRFAGGTQRPTAEWVQGLGPEFADLRRDVTRFALVLLGIAVAFAWRSARPQRSRWALAALATVALLDLGAFFLPPNMPVKRAGLLRETPGLSWLKQRAGTDRIMRVSADVPSALEDAHRLLVPNLGMRYGLHDAQGWRELIPRWYPAYWDGVAAAVVPTGVSGIPAAQFDSPLLDIARVRYLIAARPIPGLEERQVFPDRSEQNADLWVYENREALPHGWIVHRARCLPDGEVLEQLRSGAVSLRDEVLLSAWPADARSAYPVDEGMDEVTLTQDHPGHLRFDITARAPGWLVVNDTYMPGWKARRTHRDQTEEVPVQRAMVTFMAIPVVAGFQTIQVDYRPASISYGVVLTGLGWIGFLLLPLVKTHRRPQAGVPGPRPEPDPTHA